MKTPFTLLIIATLSSAHMELIFPPPLRGWHNSLATVIDSEMSAPLNALGLDYPCKGYLSDLGTPAGGSRASYLAGNTYWFGLGGTAAHGGGSCQVSLSIDEGTTFKVIRSYIGNCPFYDGAVTTAYAFTIPSDVPPGPAIFAWTWFNKMGERQMYMNCASITIINNSDAVLDAPFALFDPTFVPFASRPDIFVANIGNNCTTANSSNVEFPDHGLQSDLERYGVNTKLPIGSCGTINAYEYGQNEHDSSLESYKKCDSLHSCLGSDFGFCCSKYGYCGESDDFCGDGCNPSFGLCNDRI